MKPKDEVIKSIMDQVTISMSKSFQKIIDCCDPLLRQAYNEGYREADKHWESLKEDFGNQVKKAWQEGFDSGKKDFSMLNIEEALNYSGWLQAHDKDIAELEYKRGYDDGYKKCLAENDHYDLYDYKVGDEVIADNGTACFVITSIIDVSGCVSGVDSEGSTYSYFLSELCYKTGRHFDVGSFLEQIEVNQEK